MKSIQNGKKLTEVSQKTKQARDIHACWAWVEPHVWTNRMLTALEIGVKGGVWFSLIDKVFARESLQAAFKRILVNQGSAGVDHITVDKFAEKLIDNIEQLHMSLKEESYNPQKIRRVYIPKPGSKKKRPLGYQQYVTG